MSEGDPIRARRLPDGTLVQVMADGLTRPLADRTDWARLESMTDEEIEANALADADNPPMPPEGLARMKPVPEPKLVGSASE